MRKSFLIWLIFAIFIAIFAIQNAAPIAVKLIFTEVNISLAIIILICFTVGAAIGMFLGLKKERTLKKENKSFSNKIQDLEKEVKDLRKVLKPEKLEEVQSEEIASDTEKNNNF